MSTNSTEPQRSATDGERVSRFIELVRERGRDGIAGENSDALIRYALPITNVTAIVSPSARPRPSMMPPITPTFV